MRQGNIVIKGKFIVLTAVVFVLALQGISAGGTGEKQAASAVKIQGIVQYLEGDVTINGKPADFGSSISEGSEVRTGPGSLADIVLNEKNIIRLSENTVAVISIGELSKRVDLKSGTFSGIFAKLEAIAGSDKLEVRTPTAVAGIRGTTFFVKVIDSNNTYVCDCNGTVSFRDAMAVEQFETSAPKHEAFLFTRAGQGIAVSDAGGEFH
ncbi:MAG: hypothetical protein E4H36_10850, partial [Spirochaetales bacterium]